MGIHMGVYEIGQFVEMVDLEQLRSPPLEPPEPKRWYVLRVHPNREGKVMRTFQQRKLTGYFPMIPESKTTTQRRHGFERQSTRQVLVPLFPGMIFVPDYDADSRVMEVDGAAGMLRFGDWTAWLSPKLIADIRAMEAIGNVPISKRERKYALGDLVRIVDGPFAALSGRIDRLDSKGRLSVLVDVFGRLAPAAMSESQIEKF